MTFLMRKLHGLLLLNKGYQTMVHLRNVDVLVTGASGFIGARVTSALSQDWSVAGTWFTNNTISCRNCDMFQLDVRARAQVLDLITKKLTPRIVVHIAGTKDIKFCQAHQAETWQLHVEGTKNIVNACQDIGARIVYISTDCVFNGQKKWYIESDPTEPFNTYGMTKSAGEQLVIQSGLKSLIIRVSLLFGWSLPGQASNYVLQVLEALRDQKNVEAPVNLYNTPALIDDAAEIIARLAVDYSLEGTIHLAGKDRINRYKLAQQIAHVFRLDQARIVPVVDRSGFRQPNSCLDCQKLERVIGKQMPGIGESLEHMFTMRRVLSRVSWKPQ
jgi:dTDP-4-dehydrorhamnose reductase